MIGALGRDGRVHPEQDHAGSHGPARPADLIPGTHSGDPKHSRDALYQPGDGSQERGHYPGLVRPSLYTKAKIKMNPMITGVAALGAGLLAVTVWRSRRD
ncbi:MAG: hypothetical protein H0X59_00965 [Chloroflexi bacterium]|jgi:hypothetical protein|nr:hypothetical protein [Chloroflexota bacterium]